MWKKENGEWEGFTVASIRLDSIHFAGKHSFRDLETASRYEAQVLAKNSEGWSRPSKPYHFATYGAGKFLYTIKLHTGLHQFQMPLENDSLLLLYGIFNLSILFC